MALATLSIDLVAKLANLQAGLDQAARFAEKNAARIDAAFARTNKIAGNLGATLKSTFAGITVGALVKSIVGGLDAMVDLRDATGASIENLSALEDLAIRTGTSFDKMSDILIKFNQALNKAKPGSDISDVIKSIGLDVEKLKALDPAEALRQVAVAFDKYAADGGKARATMVLFNKTMGEAGPFLTELATQSKLTGTGITESALAAEKLSNNVSGLIKNLTDVARNMAGPLNDALTATIKLFKELDAWAEKTRTANQVLIDAAEDTRRAEAIEATTKALGNQLIVGERRLRLESKLADLLHANELKLRAAAGARGGPGPPPKPSLKITDESAKGTKEKTSEIQKYIDRLQDATVAQLDLTEAEKAQSDLLSGRLGPFTKEQADLVMNFARGLDALKAKTLDASQTAIEGMKEEIATADALRAAQAASVAELNDLLARTPTGQIKELVRQEDILRKAFDLAKISAFELDEAINTLYGTLPETVKAALTDLEKLAQEAAQTIEAEIGSSLRKILKGDFDGILADWGNMLLEMAAKAAAAQIAKDLFSGLATATSGSWLGPFFASMAAGIGTKAGGGSVKPWSMQQVNERGPEGLTVDGKDFLMMGGRGGRVTSNNNMPGGATNITLHIGAGVSRAEVFQAVQAGMNASRNAIIQSRKRGGVMA